MATTPKTIAAGPVASAHSSPGATPEDPLPASGTLKPVNDLTPDEQMALFEKELKEKDWGHQPC